MSDLILRHYWQSPYADKVRRLLGFKQLAWKSVIIPIVMPKPDLTALTAGYRKRPVLQIGADIDCDTDLIARTIDRLFPDPPLFPAPEAHAWAVSGLGGDGLGGEPRRGASEGTGPDSWWLARADASASCERARG